MTPALSSFSVGGTVVSFGRGKRIELDDTAEYRQQLARMGEGQRVVVKVEEELDFRKHSDAQRRYWFAVPCTLVGDHCGMTKDQASHYMLGACFGYMDGPGGIQIPNEPSFAALSVEKANQAIDWCLDWCPSFLEIVCPSPSKNWEQHADRIERDRRRRPA